ncbi:MAG: hypothetical protein AAGA55_01365 [Planctomycetota bacterium]
MCPIDPPECGKPDHRELQGPGLHAGHYAEITAAARALTRARRAHGVAGLSGLMILLAGLASLPFSLGSGLGIALAVALIVIGWRERSLRADIRRLDPLGFGRLARNQLALALTLSVYGIGALLAPIPTLDEAGGAGLRTMTGGDLGPGVDQAVERVAAIAHYGIGVGILLIAWLFQGGQALYYIRVGRSVRRAHARHPVWVMRVHAAAWGGLGAGHADTPSMTSGGLIKPDTDHPNQTRIAA